MSSTAFFKFVLWRNTGAAWNLLYGRNGLLAGVSLGALIALYYWREALSTWRRF